MNLARARTLFLFGALYSSLRVAILIDRRQWVGLLARYEFWRGMNLSFSIFDC